MKATIKQSGAFILLCFGSLAIVLICDETPFAGEPAGPTKWLDAISLAGDADTILVLVHVQRLNPPLTTVQVGSVMEQYKKILPNGEKSKSFTDPVGSMGFVVVRQQRGGDTKSLVNGHVAGMVYAHLLPKDDRLQARWSGRLVHSGPMNQTYVVLARSRGIDLTLAVFHVDPASNLGKYPLEFPLDKLDSWPKPLPAVSEKLIRLDPDLGADIREITVVPDRKGLLIAAHLVDTKISPYYFRYDFERKTWATAKVTPGDALK